MPDEWIRQRVLVEFELEVKTVEDGRAVTEAICTEIPKIVPHVKGSRIISLERQET